MKERLNLTIDGELLEAMKAYAASREMSVSELVESYFRNVTRPVAQESILDLVDRLETPAQTAGLPQAVFVSGKKKEVGDGV